MYIYVYLYICIYIYIYTQYLRIARSRRLATCSLCRGTRYPLISCVSLLVFVLVRGKQKPTLCIDDLYSLEKVKLALWKLREWGREE